MEPESCLATLTIVFALLTTGTVCQSSVQSNEDNIQRTLVKRMADIQDKLSDLSFTLQSMDSEIEQELKNCLGVRHPLCKALQVERGMEMFNNLDNAWGPGKRSVHEDPETRRYHNLFQELKRKRAMASHLMGVMQGANDVIRSERKRSCKVNLGFHCQTEEIMDFADMLDYLSSSKSPGKKRSVSHQSV